METEISYEAAVNIYDRVEYHLPECWNPH